MKKGGKICFRSNDSRTELRKSKLFEQLPGLRSRKPEWHCKVEDSRAFIFKSWSQRRLTGKELLLVHGAKDSIVPISQSMALARVRNFLTQFMTSGPAYNPYWCWIYLQTTHIVETWESTNWGKDQDSCEPVARYRKTIECPKPEFTISDASLPRNANEAAKSWHFVDLDVIYPFQELTMQNLLFRQQVAKICTFKIDRFCPLLNSQSKISIKWSNSTIQIYAGEGNTLEVRDLQSNCLCYIGKDPQQLDIILTLFAPNIC